jgi:hypothetical protein
MRAFWLSIGDPAQEVKDGKESSRGLVQLGKPLQPLCHAGYTLGRTGYEKLVQATGVVSIAGRDGSLVSYDTTHVQRNNTAEVILANEPDILLVCEVENIHTLRIFNNEYLSDYFDQIVLLDGNDPRGIDIGVLVRKGFSGRIARNLKSNWLFVMVNQGEEEASIAAVLCGRAGLEFQGSYEVRSTLRTRPVPPVVSRWSRPPLL